MALAKSSFVEQTSQHTNAVNSSVLACCIGSKHPWFLLGRHKTLQISGLGAGMSTKHRK